MPMPSVAVESLPQVASDAARRMPSSEKENSLTQLTILLSPLRRLRNTSGRPAFLSFNALGVMCAVSQLWYATHSPPSLPMP